MTDADLVADAAAELYAGDPAAFTERRGALAAQARSAGQAAAAKQITALRKPTHSAWLINQLVRADPGVPPQLGELGQELRSAGAALDGARLRELSQARRRLVDTLVRQALQLPGAGPPSAAVRAELTATFGAALADPQVAGQLTAGTLVRAVHRADFAPAGPGLTLVPPLPGQSGSSSPAQARSAGRTRTAVRGNGPAAAGATAAARARRERAERDRAQRAERERAERDRAERERQRAITGAVQAVAEAAQAAEAAAAAEREQRAGVRRLEDQLSEARQQLTAARRAARQAADAERAARRALGRLRG
ncbi:MAG TPA: hypothetical protein VMH35_06915 [Streptosporangiaceae bacterium]|nr:hypothetical protein [Streptosporangiaceae bacterium]